MGWLQEGSDTAKKYATDTAESERLQASLRGFGDFATSEAANSSMRRPPGPRRPSTSVTRICPPARSVMAAPKVKQAAIR